MAQILENYSEDLHKHNISFNINDGNGAVKSSSGLEINFFVQETTAD